jgi:hypothetical protein
MNLERLGARVLVLAGGLFWVAAVLGAFTGYLPEDSLLVEALVLLVATIVLFVIGLFYENLAAAIAFVIAIAAIVFGFASPGIAEAGTWALWLIFTTVPATVAGVLYLSAARMQNICQLEEARA